jgi:hypothetical protein
MNKFILLITIVGFLVSCGDKTKNAKDSGNVDPDLIKNKISANDPTAQNPEPVLSFTATVWDFGRIKEGVQVTHTYKFKNTGNEELVISSCSASCGCTTPLCDQQPVSPGEEGKIKVKFDSKNKANNINKQVTIVANTNPPTTILTIKGYVIPLGEY